MPIRALQTDDRSAWLPLWHGYHDFYESGVGEATGERAFERLIDPEIGVFGFAFIDDEGAMTGMVTYLFHVTTWSDEPRCYLNDLFTDPAKRGGGVARALIEAVYDAARAEGCEQVYWTTQEFNSTARVLYDKVATKTPFIKYSKEL